MIVGINNVIPRLPEFRFAEPLNFAINNDEQWAIIGPNGSGKTLISDIMQRKHALKEGEIITIDNLPVGDLIKSISFKDIYTLADYRNSYYQQRWHSTETDEMPVVEDLFRNLPGIEYLPELLEFFGIQDLLSKRIIFLSSGELRKFLIVRALLARPRILILDNPFIGLDAGSRGLLLEMLEQITAMRNLQVVLLLSNPEDIPKMITHVLPVCNKEVYTVRTRRDFLADRELIDKLFPVITEEIHLPRPVRETAAHTTTFRMEDVTIRYGTRTILKNLDWEVLNGEKWALLGPNGSGKSTLLSLIFADNPQGYANTLYLFDRKRGTGESIWDIKKRIGYVSPEMHLYYHENVPAMDIVGSGFFDSVGLYRKCNEGQKRSALQWMEVFGILHLKDRLFLTLSSGEQRLVLLARAFVKDPDLLILDEPLHGLDISNKRKTGLIIEQFCSQPGKTLLYVTHYIHELPASVNKQFRLQKQS